MLHPKTFRSDDHNLYILKQFVITFNNELFVGTTQAVFQNKVSSVRQLFVFDDSKLNRTLNIVVLLTTQYLQATKPRSIGSRFEFQ